LAFDKEKYTGSDNISYQTLNYSTKKTVTLYSGFKYNVSPGKYLLSIKGYARKEQVEFPRPNYGFLFSLNRVNEFNSFNNPRETELYNFNVANI